MHPSATRPAYSRKIPDKLQQWLSSISQLPGDRKRTHIVGDDLCHKALKLLQPTLPEPGTCDVVEINPGASVWSRTLHDYIKPRRHVLVQKNPGLYAKRLEPLLKAPDTAYRYAPNLWAALDPQKQLLSNANIEFREKVQTARPGEIVNNQLLLTGNLSSTRSHRGIAGKEGKQFFHAYYRSLTNKTDFHHQYGLVRALVWVDDDTRKMVVPNSTAALTKQGLQLDAAFDIYQVAGASNYLSHKPLYQRWYELSNENLEAVWASDPMSRMTPSDRRPTHALPPMTGLEPQAEVLEKYQDQYPRSQNFITEFLKLHNKLKVTAPDFIDQFTLDRNVYDNENRKSRAKGAVMDLPADQLRYVRLYQQFRARHNSWNINRSLIHENRAMWHRVLDATKAGWFRSSVSSATNASPLVDDDVANVVQRRRKDLLKEYNALANRTQARPRMELALIHKAIDDYRAYDSKTQCLAWNRRTFEPLIAHEDEFYPSRGGNSSDGRQRRALALVSLTPRREFLTRLDTTDKMICFEYICTTLSMHPTDTILQAMKRLVPAGTDQFIGSVPDLRDVRKGGFFDLEGARIRALPRDTWISLAVAFEKWPHRPSIERLLMVQEVFNE